MTTDTKQSRRLRSTETIGTIGVAIYSGYVDDREKSGELTRHNRYTTYADILSNTSIAAAGIRYYANLCGGAEWTFQPSEMDADGMYAELAESILMLGGITNWTRVVRRAAMYRFYGFSVQEWTAVRRGDGWLGYSDIAPRAQSTIERWDAPSGIVQGVYQRSPQDGKELYIPRDKVLYIVDDTLSDSPEGMGLFRHLVSPSKRLARYEQLEGEGFETDLRGIPIARVPISELREQLKMEGLSNEAINAEIEKLAAPLKNAVSNHIRKHDTGFMLDSQTYRNEDASGSPSSIHLWDMTLLQGDSQSFAENAAAIERINREIARILGVEQLMLGTGAGSFALSEDKTHQFYLLVNGALNEICEQVRIDLLVRLWELNGWDAAMMPELKVSAIEYRDVKNYRRDSARYGNCGSCACT